ncbi:hypothetical protein [Secundilactobacillus muriivasis]
MTESYSSKPNSRPEMLSKQKISAFIKKVKSDGKPHWLTNGIYVKRLPSGDIKFLAYSRAGGSKLYEMFNTFNEAVEAVNKYLDTHTIRSEKLNDLTGQKFGHLTVIKQAPSKNARTYWLCECDLDGNQVAILAPLLLSGNRITCGKDDKAHREARSAPTHKFIDEYGINPGTISMGPNKRNSTGIRGVSVRNLPSGDKRYRASISFGGKHEIGHEYDDIQDAIAERKEMENRKYKPIIKKMESDGIELN